MQYKINSQVSLELITLEEAKSHCRLVGSFTKDDSYITNLIATCSNLAQVYCNRMLSTGVITSVLTYYKQSFMLWGGDVASVDSLTAIDTSGNLVTITDFTFNTVTQEIRIPTTYSYHYDFTLTYTAGYTVLPTQIKHAVMLMLSTLYNNRDDYVTGLTVANLPMSSKILLNSVKHYVS